MTDENQEETRAGNIINVLQYFHDNCDKSYIIVHTKESVNLILIAGTFELGIKYRYSEGPDKTNTMHSIEPISIAFHDRITKEVICTTCRDAHVTTLLDYCIKLFWFYSEKHDKEIVERFNEIIDMPEDDRVKNFTNKLEEEVQEMDAGKTKEESRVHDEWVKELIKDVEASKDKE